MQSNQSTAADKKTCDKCGGSIEGLPIWTLGGQQFHPHCAFGNANDVGDHPRLRELEAALDLATNHANDLLAANNREVERRRRAERRLDIATRLLDAVMEGDAGAIEKAVMERCQNIATERAAQMKEAAEEVPDDAKGDAYWRAREHEAAAIAHAIATYGQEPINQAEQSEQRCNVSKTRQ